MCLTSALLISHGWERMEGGLGSGWVLHSTEVVEATK